MAEKQTITFKNARIIYSNFEGVPHDTYNKEGGRSFTILLDEERAREMEAEGWNIKLPKPTGDAEKDANLRPRLDVTISKTNDFIHPSVKMFLVDGGVSRRISSQDLDTVTSLDKLALAGCDIVVSAYHWVTMEDTPHERRGIKAYLSIGYFKLYEADIPDPFAADYASGDITDDDLPF